MHAHINTNQLTHSCLLFARRRYGVKFNTQILDILYGCELLSNSNWRLASARFTCLPAGHCHRRSSSKPLPHTQATIVLSRYSNPVIHSHAWLWLPSIHQGSSLVQYQHISLFMMGPVVASSLLNVKGMLIKWCGTPIRCWNQRAKVYSVSTAWSETREILCAPLHLIYVLIFQIVSIFLTGRNNISGRTMSKFVTKASQKCGIQYKMKLHS